MIRPQVVEQLACPSFGLATSWVISRQGQPSESLEEVKSLLRREFWPFAKTGSTKNDSEARRWREKANECYKREPEQVDKILRLYNESICRAAEDGTSEEAGMGYANRSAVYFNGKLYRNCLNNVELAKANNYPEGKMEKLLERERKCLAALEEQQGNGTTPEGKATLDEDRIRSNLQLIETGQTGRGLTSKTDLQVGDVVLIEKPFLSVLEPEAIYSRCNNCGSKKELDLIPCKTCCCAMYCSEQCRDEALSISTYHKFECEIVEDLKTLFRGPKPTRMFLLTLRLFWMAISDLQEDPEKFRQSYEKELSRFRNPLELNPSDYLLHVLSGEVPDPDTDLTGKGVTQFMIALIYKITVEENTSVPSELREKHESLLLKILYDLVLLAKNICDQSVADLTCYYPLLQMINHSCAPNAERFMIGERSALMVKRPIKAGEQILICYLPNGSSDHQDKTKRQEMLKNAFEFDCQCLGCSLDYPSLVAMKENDTLRAELDGIKQTSGTVERLKLLEEFLQRYDDQYPQKELAEAWALYKPEKIRQF